MISVKAHLQLPLLPLPLVCLHSQLSFLLLEGLQPFQAARLCNEGQQSSPVMTEVKTAELVNGVVGTHFVRGAIKW